MQPGSELAISLLKTTLILLQRAAARKMVEKGRAGSAWGSYTVVVHELGASTGQSVGEKLSCFNSCRSQLRTALKRKKNILTLHQLSAPVFFIICSLKLGTNKFSQM